MLRFSSIVDIVESAIFDIGRIWENEKEIEKYRNRMFRKIFEYSKRIPLYREKYRDIPGVRTIKDIRKLPLVSKGEIKRGFPDDIIDNRKRCDLVLMSTSGSTGKPTRIYRDLASIIRGYILSLRVFKAHGINYRKERIMVIGDFAVENSYDYKSINLLDRIGVTKLYRNFIFVPFDKDIGDMVEIFRKFKPTAIFGYPVVLAEMAREAMKKGLDLSEVKFVGSSGYVLDNYTRNFLEDAYGVKVVDVYGSIEIDTAMFQCKEGFYHINSDLIYLEILDSYGEPVSPGESGKVVATRLYGRDTPIIRYSGLEDIVTTTDEKCNCGINTEVVRRIEGRAADAIVLPDGRVISPFVATTLIVNIMRELRSEDLRQFQIVQRSRNDLSIKLVLDEECKNHEEILRKTREVFSRELNLDVDVKIVDKVDNYGRELPPPVVSEVWKKTRYKQ